MSSDVKQERWTTCPSCERPVRLAPHELEAKRGFCASCDARFDIAQGTVRDALSPFRGGAALELVPMQTRSSGIVEEVTPDGHPRLIVRSVGRGLALLKALALAWLGGGVCVAFITTATPLLPVAILFMSMLLLVLAWQARPLLGSDVLEVHDGALWHRVGGVGGPRERLPLHEIRSIALEAQSAGSYALHVEREGAPPLIIARRLGYDRETVLSVEAWLERRITAELEARAPPRLAGGDASPGAAD